MREKILTSLIFIIIGMMAIPITASAQRAIDPSLKPLNAPDMPKTGIATEEACQNEGGVWDENSKLCSTAAEEPINAYLQILGGAILMLSGGIAVVVIAVGGIMYVTSRGNQQQLEFAKSTLMYGVIGMLVIIFSYFIVQWVLKIILEL